MSEGGYHIEHFFNYRILKCNFYNLIVFFCLRCIKGMYEIESVTCHRTIKERYSVICTSVSTSPTDYLGVFLHTRNMQGRTRFVLHLLVV